MPRLDVKWMKIAPYLITCLEREDTKAKKRSTNVAALCPSVQDPIGVKTVHPKAQSVIDMQSVCARCGESLCSNHHHFYW